MTSSIAATGPLAEPLKLAADLIASSAEFQSLVGAASSTEALAHIYEGESRAEDLPRCIIEWHQFAMKKVSNATWTLEGVIAALIEKEVPRTAYVESYEDEGRRWRIQVGHIAAEMQQSLIAVPHLYPNIIEIDVPPVELPEPDERAGSYVFGCWLGLAVEGSAL